MVVAYILVKVNLGKETEVYKNMKGLADVKEITGIYGEYDLLLKVEVSSIEELDSFIFETLRLTPDVTSTTTLIAVKL